MDKGDNSTKRDRLTIGDLEKILEVESRTGIYPMSWYSKIVWEYIKKNYKLHPEKVATIYRDMLKQSMFNFMFILGQIIHRTQNGKDYLINCFLEQNAKYFDYAYEFDEKGNIIEQSPRHFTDRNSDEMQRYFRIAINSVDDYNAKENRNLTSSLDQDDFRRLAEICEMINNGDSYISVKSKIESLVAAEENAIIEKYTQSFCNIPQRQTHL